MLKALTLFAMCGLTASAESSLGAPFAGVARDNQKQLHILYGVAGNFVLGDALGDKVVNWEFAGNGGLVETETALLRLDAAGATTRSSPAPHGDAILAPAGPQTLPLYFSAETAELWQAGTLEDHRSPIEPDAIAGRVLAIRSPNLQQAELAVCRANHLWLLTIDWHTGLMTRQTIVEGALGELACHPPQPGALLLLNGWLLLATPKELIAQTSAGSEHRIPLWGDNPSQPQLHQSGEDWVQIESAGQIPMLFRLAGDGWRLYRLPSVAAPK